MPNTTLKPRAAVRRFDIFAEYNRRKAVREGHPAPEAKGYGLWLAKLVAARRFGRSKAAVGATGEAHGQARPRSRWHNLSGVPQTDKLFDKEIIQRMGSEFYRRVFSPAVGRAFKRGEPYEAIRDSLRADWKPVAK